MSHPTTQSAAHSSKPYRTIGDLLSPNGTPNWQTLQPVGCRILTTGITFLDFRIGGLLASDLILVAARPGMGSSALLNTILINAARFQSPTVAYFSMQTSPQVLITRLVSIITGIDSKRLLTMDFAETDHPALQKAASFLANQPIIIDRTARFTPTTLCKRCHDIRTDHGGLDLIIIDGVDMIRLDHPASAFRTLDAGIADALKHIALVLDVPVLVAFPLACTVAERRDKTPRPTDIPDPWLQAADIVIGPHHDDYYQDDSDDLVDARLFILKNRHGRNGPITVDFRKDLGHFINIQTSGP